MSARRVRLAVVLAMACAAGAAHAEGARTVSLAECVDLALARNPEMDRAAVEVEVAEGEGARTRAGYGPRLRIDANITRWDGPFDVPFGTTSFQVRDALTSGATVTLTQPLSALFLIHAESKVNRLGVEVARLEQGQSQRELANTVVESYYRLLQARSLAAVATTSVSELEAHLTLVKAYEAQQVVGKNERLRAELAVGNARQRLLQVQAGADVAEARLALLIGLPAGTALTPRDVPTTPPPVLTLDLGDAERQALTTRSELAAGETRIAAAHASERVSWLKLWPQIDAIGSYQRTDGSKFQQKNAFFVGLFATWNAWDWGATYQGYKTAGLRARQARDAQLRVRDTVSLELRTAYRSQATAASALTVAQQAIEQAEENDRIEHKRYELHANTSVDVLDAEALLTQARAQYQTGLYDYLIARAALRRAMGEPARAIAEATR